MNIAITAPKYVEISFATMNRIRDILMRNDDGFQQIFTTYEVVHNFHIVKNVNKVWLVEKVREGRLDMLIVVGYDRDMPIIQAAEEAGIDVVLFRET